MTHAQRGQALVEFTLVSMVALLVLFGIIELGRALYSYHLVSNAARLGTRYAIVNGSDCAQTLSGCSAASADTISSYVRAASPGIDPPALTVSTTWSTGPNCAGAPYQGAGCTVTVTASYTFSSVVPLLNLAHIPMSSTSSMIVSQ
jgi:Flp pilus assembly protein TadG